MNNSKFIETIGDHKTFNSNEELISFFEKKDFHQDTRKNENLNEDQGERYFLKIYLLTLAHNQKLNYPLDIQKSESPDFIIKNDVNIYGIEATQGTTSEMGNASNKLLNTEKFGTIIHSESGPILLEKGKPLHGSPLTGNADIEIVSNLILLSFERKIKLFNKEHFKKYNKNILIIGDTFGLVIEQKKHEKLLNISKNMIAKNVKSQKYKSLFDEVVFIKNNNMFTLFP